MLLDICKSVQECSVSVVNGAEIAAIGEVGGGIEELRCNDRQGGETGISEWTRPERRPLTHLPLQERAVTRRSASPTLEPMGKKLDWHPSPEATT